MAVSKPHILFFLSDQHSPHVAGCYGDAYVHTPTLDRLAREGVRFDACYCDNPLCVPSRMAMLTGQCGHRLQIWTNNDSLDSTVPTLAHGMAIAGYRTVLTGRMHFVGGDQHHGFEERVVGDVTSGYVGMNRAEHRFRGYYGDLSCVGEGNSFDLCYDTTVAMEACRIIRDHEVSGDPRPLFLMVSFYSPHDPYVMPADRLAPYLDCDDEPVDAAPETLPSYSQKRLQNFGWDADTRRRARAAYRAKTQFVDELMEKVVVAWRESPLAENTVTVYTSDHGDLQGEHGLWAKGSYYEGSARVPLLLSAPGRLEAGRVVDRPLSLIDLGPTLLDLAGAPPLPQASGRSVWPALQGDTNAWPECVYSEQAKPAADEASRMVRQGPWKYIHYTGNEAELYHLDDDPNECRNLAEDPQHADTRRRLHERLFADGWDPEAIRARLARRASEYKYLYQYARAREPRDSVQWGLPAQL